MNSMTRTTVESRFDQDRVIRRRRISRELDRLLGDEHYPQAPDFVVVWPQATAEELLRREAS